MTLVCGMEEGEVKAHKVSGSVIELIMMLSNLREFSSAYDYDNI